MVGSLRSGQMHLPQVLLSTCRCGTPAPDWLVHKPASTGCLFAIPFSRGGVGVPMPTSDCTWGWCRLWFLLTFHGGQVILAWGQWQPGQIQGKRGVFAWLALERVAAH